MRSCAAVRVLRCKEFKEVCLKTGLGFLVTGFIGFFVKLIFIGSRTPQRGWTASREGLVKLIAIAALGLLAVSALFYPRTAAPLGCLTTQPPRHVGAAEPVEYEGAPAEATNRFTLFLNSYHRRDLLQKSVQRYSKCPRIDAIRVIWCEDEPPPVHGQSSSAYFSSLKEVQYDEMPDSSLNNRFRPLEGLRTEAVLSIDDDIYLPCSELDRAFEVWQKRKRAIVGFFPRANVVNQDCSQRYLLGTGTFWKGEYSMVLTKAAFLHRDYLERYTNHMPRELRDYVDAHHNCEDVAMQFMVANVTHEAPEFVNTLWIKDIGKGPRKVKGISSDAQHTEARTQCLNDMTRMYGGVVPLTTRPLSDHGSLLWIRTSPILASVLGFLW
eukprot:evm.model.scf_473.9 EVM.evm.TU.scf_473.9   scf_473:50116-57649(-)